MITLARRSALTVLCLLLVPGCGMDVQIIKDMESASQQTKQDNVSSVVQKYLPAGMSLGDALKFLRESDFEITEFRQDGFHKWPDGELWPYQDAGHKKAALGDQKVRIFGKEGL